MCTKDESFGRLEVGKYIKENAGDIINKENLHKLYVFLPGQNPRKWPKKLSEEFRQECIDAGVLTDAEKTASVTAGVSSRRASTS